MARTKRDLDYLLLIAGGDSEYINKAVSESMDKGVLTNLDLIIRKQPALERIYADHNDNVKIQFRKDDTVMLRFAYDYLDDKNKSFSPE